MKQQDKVFMAVGSSVVTALALVTGIYLFGGDDANTNLTSTSSSGAAASTSDSAVTSSTDTTGNATATSSPASTYKDGTYSATVSYYVPHSEANSLTAKVTVRDSKITAVVVNHDYSDNESGMYVDSFDSVVQNAVVGQDVGSLSLGRIGGATLTTQAFDNALTTIRNDAKA